MTGNARPYFDSLVARIIKIMEMIKPIRYRNLFPGKPKLLKLPRLFLFESELETKLGGESFNHLYKLQGKESLFKRLSKSVETRTDPTIRVRRELMDLFPVGDFKDLFHNAMIEGDLDAIKKIESIGEWEVLGLVGLSKNENISYTHDYIMSIERALRTPELLAEEERYGEVLDLLLDDSLLSPLIWRELIPEMRRAPNRRHWLACRFVVAIELRLSLAAAVDVNTVGSAIKSESYISKFMPSTVRDRLPFQKLTDWLKEQVGASSLMTLETRINETKYGDKNIEECLISLDTLRNWSSGRAYPDLSLFKSVALRLQPDVDWRQAMGYFAAAQELHLIGYLAGFVTEAAKRQSIKTGETIPAPWSAVLWGHAEVESWWAARYPVWWEYHQSRFESFQSSAVSNS